MKQILIFLLITLFPATAWCGGVESDPRPLTELFEEPCQSLAIPKPLVLAIAAVESDLKPWMLNIEGRSFHFDSKEKALQKAEEAWVTGRSFDMGLMQVNDWWLQKYGVSPETALDPLANIYFGGWILKQELIRHDGDVRAAVGAYHSPNPARANRYAERVMNALERDPKVEAVPAQNPAIKRVFRSHNVARQASELSVLAPMLVVSGKKALANPQSMKAAATAASHSMKVKL